MTTSANTVVVGCKLPAGIFMQGYKMETTQEPILGGGFRDVKIAVPHGPKIKINGNAAPQGSVPTGYVDGGYVLTRNVPKETADAWMLANKDSPLVKNKLIIVHDKEEGAAAQSKNNHSTRSGLERLDVGTKTQNGREVPADYRWPRSKHANLTNIATDDKK